MSEHRPSSLGELKADGYTWRSVKDEMRANLVAKLRSGEELFPGIKGYSESVVPSIVNAVLSKHDFILLGLRGQAKSRILRQLISLLDEEVPIIGGGRLTGRAGRFTLGLLNIQTDEEPSAGALSTNFTVARLKRDVLRRSSIGAIVTHRSARARCALSVRYPGRCTASGQTSTR